MNRRNGIITGLLLLIGVTHTALAHDVGTSYLRLQSITATALHTQTGISVRDLEFAIGLDADNNAQITWDEIVHATPAIAAYVTARLHLTQEQQTCTFAAPEIALEQHNDNPYVALTLSATCRTAGFIAVRSDLLFDIDASHRTLLEVTTDNQHTVNVLTRGTRTWRGTQISVWHEVKRFTAQGVWHIWTGFDHLAFLMLLLLPIIRQPLSATSASKRIFKVVTAFTLAHSITLLTAAAGLIHFSSRWVEATIAASIVFTGITNVLSRNDRHGMTLAFGFGLVHGLGFASTLSELTAATNSRLLPLFGFNIGVELGQLIVVACVCGVWFTLQRTVRLTQKINHAVVTASSLASSALGLFWLVQRLIQS